MPQSKKKTKSASGMGSIRKVTKTVKGKQYTYYEARYAEGFDPEPVSRSSAASPARPRRKSPRS